MNKAFLKTLVMSSSAIIIAFSIIIYPKETYMASVNGLKMWWDVVFPSLMPFFILSEVLMGLGVVHLIGVLFEPLMRPLFRVPGSGGFVWAMGISSGFPAGAKLTARLWHQKQITTIEAERLVSFTNCSNPLFMFSAIAVGFFHNAALGIVLAVSHYLGNFFVGLIMRFHGFKKDSQTNEERYRGKGLKNALKHMHEARLADNRPIGQLLGDAVQQSTKTLLMIGGFIILFSVLSKMMDLLHVAELLSSMVNYFFLLFSLSETLSLPLIKGIFEITLGSNLTSLAQSSLLQQAVIVSFILAFSGLSVQAQVASILADTDIKFKPFFVARIMHGFLSAFICLLVFPYLYHVKSSAAPAFAFLTEKSENFGEFGMLALANSHYVTLGFLLLSILLWNRTLLKKNSLRT
ncbi:sporulation integral membrane protein YlbJ [Fictibacillus phosphorivorans]|uniref:Sporulation integral membrane protein YlbJ n=1 Tax=Fictibacillus phosphorivorans TaxID=1221500 RepID=A0A163PCM9_9BACL|nr:sporulation integral membrane protein YlbJ [Fictibacillus phosphorivorans]KZE63333.1 sporulation integral membrane protein YlbJ [Fictibacillus phosphorivorans]